MHRNTVKTKMASVVKWLYIDSNKAHSSSYISVSCRCEDTMSLLVINACNTIIKLGWVFTAMLAAVTSFKMVLESVCYHAYNSNANTLMFLAGIIIEKHITTKWS